MGIFWLLKLIFAVFLCFDSGETNFLSSSFTGTRLCFVGAGVPILGAWFSGFEGQNITWGVCSQCRLPPLNSSWNSDMVGMRWGPVLCI